MPVEDTWGDGRAGRGARSVTWDLEAAPATVRRAHAVHPVAGQYEWSPFSRDPEDELVPTLRELGIGLVAYSPLLGFLSGRITSPDDFGEDDFRRDHPRFTGRTSPATSTWSSGCGSSRPARG